MFMCDEETDMNNNNEEKMEIVSPSGVPSQTHKVKALSEMFEQLIRTSISDSVINRKHTNEDQDVRISETILRMQTNEHGPGGGQSSQKPKISVDCNHVRNKKHFFERQVQAIEGSLSPVGLSKAHSKSTHYINNLYNNKSANLNGYKSRSTEILDVITNGNDDRYSTQQNNRLLYDINNEEKNKDDRYNFDKYHSRYNTTNSKSNLNFPDEILDIENCISYVNDELNSIDYNKPDQPKWTVLDYAKQQKVSGSTFSDLVDIEDEFGTLLQIDNDFCVETFNNGNENVLFKIHLGRELYSDESIYNYVPIISDINYGDIQEEIYYTVLKPTQEEEPEYEKPEYCFIEKAAYEEEKDHMTGTFFDRNRNPRIEIIEGDTTRNSFIERFQASKSQKLIVKELLDTEETYLTNLKYVIDFYIEHFRKSEDQPDINLVFGNIEEIYNETDKFYSNMQECNSIDEIAMVFINNAEIFDFYTRYLRNKPKSNQYVYSFFKDVLKRRQAELDDPYSWDSHLLTPVQRPGRYKLLLEKIKESLTKSGDKSELLTKAIILVDKKIHEANTLMTIDSIQQCPYNLAEMGEFLLKETFNLRKKYRSVMFLFEKILVFCVEEDNKSEFFEYVESIPMDKLSIKHSSKSLSFQLTNFNKSKSKKNAKYEFVVEAPSMVIKEKWVDEIQRILWVQLQYYKDQQMKSASNESALPSARSLFNITTDSGNVYEQIQTASLANEDDAEEYERYDEIYYDIDKDTDTIDKVEYEPLNYNADEYDTVKYIDDIVEEDDDEYENVILYDESGAKENNQTLNSTYENTDDGDAEEYHEYEDPDYYRVIQANITYDEGRDHMSGTFFDKDVNPRIQILRSESSVEESTLLRNIPTAQYMIIKELIETEETYISKMKHIIDDYLQHFRNAGIPLDINIVFGNIEDLYKKTEEILFSMKLCGSVDAIANVFLENLDVFDLYTLYMRNKPMSYQYANTKFRKLIKDRQVALEDHYTCDTYLLNPIQRPVRYKLLLEKLQKELHKIGGSCESLNEALKLLSEKITGANTMMMIDSIEGCPLDLHKAGPYIMRDTLNIKRKYRSTIFLFKEAIVFCEEIQNNDKYKYVDSIEMRKLSLSHKRPSSSFQLRNYDHSKFGDDYKYVFDIETPSLSVKEKWIEEIQRVLWNQLQYYKDQQKTVSETITTSPLVRKGSSRYKNKSSPSQKRSSSTFYYNI